MPERKIPLPEGFAAMAAESLGRPVTEALLAVFHSDTPASVSVRANSGKLSREQLAAHFGEEAAGTVPWCGEGIYLKKRPSFTMDPLFHAGGYYVQEASSMFLELVRRAVESDAGPGYWDGMETVLDLCAAPGGKSTHLAGLISGNTLLVSNEVIRSRAVVLADNMARWGTPNAMVTSKDPSFFSSLTDMFSLVLADVPCSGEGMFRKDPSAREQWSEDAVRLCAARQQRILADVWPAVAPGGYLVYSTCTFNRYENDGNLMFLIRELGASPVSVPEEDELIAAGILKTPCGGYQFVPGRVEGEGQFFAVLRKPFSGAEKRVPAPGGGNPKLSGVRNHKRGGKERSGTSGGKQRGGKEILRLAKAYLQPDYIVEETGPDGLLKGYPEVLFSRIRSLEEALHPLLSGTAVAAARGKDCIPHPDLALSEGMAAEAFCTQELSLKEALAFLSKEPLAFPGLPDGFLLLTYKGFGLGFVKNMGNRANNLWPLSRRIRMALPFGGREDL